MPSNIFLPKPSIVIEAFKDLWEEYELFKNYILTVAIVYISMTAAYYLVSLFKNFLLKSKTFFADFLFSIEWFSKYVPGILLGCLLIFWFPNSELTQFLFAFLLIFFSFFIKVQNELKKINYEFIDAAKGFGADEKFILKNVKWKIIQPEIINHLIKLHLYFWTAIILFEFIKDDFGMGIIFKQVLMFKDLSGFIALILITGATIYLGSWALKYLKKKFFFWG
ncbi:MAG: ABC transporter permease subunit [Ignavibacteriaceae bacterium]